MNLESPTVNLRRTTVTAKRSSLDTLEAEARRRGVTLTAVLAEAIDEKANALHVSRRPRLGIARSTDGLSAAELTAEPVAHPPS
jgi:predicted DNA-binding ribbon-helix-helix protein